MKLLEITRFLSLLVEGIDIHGLARLHRGEPGFEQAVKDYRSTIQGRKKELLKPFGLDDLDKFKDNPKGFVRMVQYAKESFAEKKEETALYKRLYEDDKCLITMPKGPEGAAAAGSFLKQDGAVVCPWCIAVKYPDNERWWKRYEAEGVFFVYSKDRKKVINNAWCMVMTEGDCKECLAGRLVFSQLESQENKGLSDKKRSQLALLKKLLAKTHLDEAGFLRAIDSGLHAAMENIERKEREKRFIVAVTQNDIKSVQEYIANGIDVNAKNGIPINAAAKAGYLEICKLLVRAGADFSTPRRFDESPLSAAAQYGHLDVCKFLVEAGLDKNPEQLEAALLNGVRYKNMEICDFFIDRLNRTGAVVPEMWRDALELAVLNGHLELCKRFIAMGASVNFKNEFGRTLLMEALHKEAVEVVRLLLDEGANVNARDNTLKTPLFYALDNLELAKMLIDAGADVNARDKDNDTPILSLCINKVFKLLIDSGADTRIENNRAYTPLLYAIFNNNKSACKILIDSGVDINAENSEGITPLEYAVRGDKGEICEMLLNAGAGSKQFREEMLHLSVFEMKSNALDALIDAGVDVDAAGKGGNTPLFIAAKDGSLVMMAKLVGAGADVNAKNDSGSTPLMVATFCKYDNICNYLIQKGADPAIKNNAGQTAADFK